MTAGIDHRAKEVSRREFLTYVWGASAALLAAEAGGAAIWYALPHFRSGLPDGLFQFGAAVLPEARAELIAYPEGKFWLSNTANGLLALSMSCVAHNSRSVFYKWLQTNHRFECPVCGSKYSLDGQHLQISLNGPARRALDRFVIRVETPSGTLITPADGSPVSIDGATRIIVDTNKKILGQPD